MCAYSVSSFHGLYGALFKIIESSHSGTEEGKQLCKKVRTGLKLSLKIRRLFGPKHDPLVVYEVNIL